MAGKQNRLSKCFPCGFVICGGNYMGISQNNYKKMHIPIKIFANPLNEQKKC